MPPTKISFWSLDNKANSVKEGTISLENGQLVADTPLAKAMLARPISPPPGNALVTADDPQAFLAGLPKFYRSAYFSAVPEG